MKKHITLIIFLFLVSFGHAETQKGIITVPYHDAEGNIGKLISPDLEEDAITLKGGVLQVDNNNNRRTITFTKENSLFKYQGKVLTNIKPETETLPSYLILDDKGNIIGGEITVNEKGSIYSLNNQRISAPPNTHVQIIDKDHTKIILPDSAKLTEYPVINRDTSGIVEVTGKNIQLPNGYNLRSGTIQVQEFAKIASPSDPPTINGFTVHDGASIEFAQEQNMLERWSDDLGTRVLFNGKEVEVRDGARVTFDPEAYVTGIPTATERGYLKALNLETANNKKYFYAGDKGEHIRLIQRFVSSEETGEYDKKTVQAVLEWQKAQNGKLAADGKFGKNSLIYALQESSATMEVATTFESEGEVRVFKKSINKKEGLGLDVVEQSTIKVGNRKFVVTSTLTQQGKLLNSLNGKTLKVGSKGNDVSVLHDYLQDTGFLDGIETKGLLRESYFGSETEEALRRWQEFVYQSHGMCVGAVLENKCKFDGIFGKKSLAAAQKFEKQPEVYQELARETGETTAVPVELTVKNWRNSVTSKVIYDPSDVEIKEEQKIKENNEVITTVRTSMPAPEKMKRNYKAYVYIDRATQLGYYIQEGQIVQNFVVGVGTGNDPDNPNPSLATPSGIFSVSSIQKDKPVGKWSQEGTLGILKPNEGYKTRKFGVPIGKLASVYGPGFFSLRDDKTGKLVQYGIHGTSCYGNLQLHLTPSGSRYFSHGCIRMTNSDWNDLSQRITPGTKVVIG